MHKAMFIQLAIGLLIGGGLGALMGYFGKCTTGGAPQREPMRWGPRACPLTANPWRGGFIGAVLGGFMAFSAGSSRWTGEAGESEHLQVASAESFDAQVLGAQQPVLVDFYSDSCGPCRMLAPTIEKLAEEYEGRAVVYKVSVDRLPQLASRYGIQGIPSVLFFQNGREVERLIGLRSRSEYTGVLDRLIDSAT